MKKIGLLVLGLIATMTAYAQHQIPMLGETAPSFNSNSTNGEINFPEDFGESWKILLSHPEDFTPICTSEIMHLSKMQDEFVTLGVKIAVLSMDDLSTHFQWKKSMEETLVESTGSGKIDFPLIADSKGEVSNMYGMLDYSENQIRNVRGVFIIDPANKIRSMNFYPMNVGRNMEEIKRIVIALQTSEKEQVLMPVNWNEGDDFLVKDRPYTESELKDNPDLANQYYRVGLNLWYKKGK
jgi:peroxiredoxin (alkyl hydroperoxide reductase subunit C)